MKSIFKIIAFWLYACLSASAALPNAWHIPDNAIVTGNGGATPTMRNPRYEITNSSTFQIYTGFQKFENNVILANQTGGTVFFKTASQGVWSSASLSFHADSGNDQFWYASIDMSTLPPNEVVQYYFYLTFGSEAQNSYIYGGGDQGGSLVTAAQSTAQAAPFTFRNRPAWIFHSNNRVANGNNVQFWAKVGYQTDPEDPASRWADSGRIYYTTDNSEPTGALGVGTGSTQVANFSFSHPETLSLGQQNPTGTAMWWATESIALPPLTPIKYRIGFWNSANNEEKFADYNAGTPQTFQFSIGNAGDPVLTVSTPTNGTLNGNYTTTKLFIDEIAGNSETLSITFQPGQLATQVEVVTNLNQRDFANIDKNGNGEPDGIEFNQDESIIGTDTDHYYQKYAMDDEGDGEYTLELPATRTGAYRLTARWKVDGDPDWRWFTYHPSNRRDHAITVTPVSARDINLYEINTLTIEANSDNPNGIGGIIERSTFEDLYDAPSAHRTGDERGFNLHYLSGLGVNWLWFQPIHPPAIDGRELDRSTDEPYQPYNPGSPYAVKNFFQVNPWMSADYDGVQAIGSSEAREDAMNSFVAFMEAADETGIGVMLDAPFNHTGRDVEFDDVGVDLFQRHDAPMPNGGATEIRSYDTRFFSRNGDYAQRATLAEGQGPAVAPDRGDFGKWNDTVDVYFGRYDALVNQNPADNSNYTNEGDRFYYAAIGQETPNNPVNENWTSIDFFQGPDSTEPRNVTKQTWKYFARYATYWLEKTRAPGNNRNSSTEPSLTTEARYEWDNSGIDGLRCDFGQGLPPQAWEYMINVARSYKWNFVMMSESLDGGAVTYRSNRHFDILNENIVFPLKSAGNSPDYRALFESRRSAYGQGLVLLNNTSHDEENYENIWFALMRYNVASTVDGAPMIFMGQELGVTRTSGFSFYETNFGKQVAHFKKFNSMKPGWLKRLPVDQGGGGSPFGEEFIWDAYSAPGQARLFSSALRSSNRFYLNRKSDGQPRNEIWAVAKYETPNASPATSDVVFCFVNLRTEVGPEDTFNVDITQNGTNLFGIESGKYYNVKNISAYTKIDFDRRNVYLWEVPRSGADILANGIYVDLNPLPGTAAEWATAPYENQFLKLYEIESPPPIPPTPSTPELVGSEFDYVIGGAVTFTWTPGSDPEGGISGYWLQIGTSPNGSDVFDAFVNTTSHTVNVSVGTTLYARVRQFNNADVSGSYTPSSAAVRTLAAGDDEDGDGQSNGSEDVAGTNPFDSASSLRLLGTEIVGNNVTVTCATVPGKSYRLFTSDDLVPPWVPLGDVIVATEDETTFTHVNGAGDERRFYRVGVTP